MLTSISSSIPRSVLRETMRHQLSCNRFSTVAHRSIRHLSPFIPRAPVGRRTFSSVLLSANFKLLGFLSVGVLGGTTGTFFFYSQKEARVAKWAELLKVDLPAKNGLIDPTWVARCEEACFNKALEHCEEGNWAILPLGDNSLQNLKDRWGRTLFLACVEMGNQKCVEYLIRKDYGIRITDKDGNNGLHIAAARGHISLISIFIQHFAVNDYNSKGFAPIHLAIQAGSPVVLDELMRCTSLSNIATQDGVDNSVTLALKWGQKECLDSLIQKGKLIPDSIFSACSAINLCIEHNKTEMLKHILTKYFEASSPLLNSFDNHGIAPLHLAAKKGLLDVIRLLASKGVNMHLQDGNGFSCVHWAVSGNHPDAIQLLCKLGANLRSLDKNGKEPLSLVDLDKANGQRCRALLLNLIGMGVIGLMTRPDFLRNPPENLVLEGGGPNGIAYVGALKKMEELGLLQDVKRVAGTSAGAITASLIAVGYSPDELKGLLAQIDMQVFLNYKDPFYKTLIKGAEEGNWKKIIKDFWNGGPDVIGRGINLYRNLSTTTGLCDNTIMREWIENCIEKKTGKKYCTFKELHKLVGENGSEKFKELQVFSIELKQTNLTQLECFNSEGTEYEDLIISDAVMASANIPGVFQPHILHFKDKHGKRYPRADLIFVDGGLLKNLPIDAFDSGKYQNPPQWADFTNPKTLGIKLFAIDRTQPNAAILNPKDLVQSMIMTFWHSQDILYQSQANFRDRVLELNINAVPLTKFELSDAERAKLIKEGEDSVGAFFLGEKK